MHLETAEVMLQLLSTLHDKILTAHLADGSGVHDVTDVRMWLRERMAALSKAPVFE